MMYKTLPVNIMAGHADALCRLRFEDDEYDSVAVAMATFEKPVIDAEKLRKEIESNELTKRMMNRIRTGNWKNCTKMENDLILFQMPLQYNNFDIYRIEKFFNDYQSSTSHFKFSRRPSKNQCFDKLCESNA